jgi:hypothetical protein
LPELPPERMRDAIRLAEYHRAHAIRAYELLGVIADDRPVGLPRRILAAFERASSPEIGRRELHELLGGHVPADDLSRALDDLRDRGLIEFQRVSTGGRPAEVYRRAKNSESEQTKLDEQCPGSKRVRL